MDTNARGSTHPRLTGSAGLAGLGIVIAVLSLAACQPPPPVEQHRAAIEAMYGKLRALDAPVRDAPPLAEDARIDAGGERVVLEGPDANALYVAWVHLGTPEKAGPYGTGAEVYTAPVQTCTMALTGQKQFRSEDVVAAHLQQCARAEYVFVLRTISVEYPKIVDDQSFTAGWYDGEVRLYRLADGSSLGGFRAGARNSDSIDFVVGQHGVDASAAVALNREVSGEVQRQIEQGLRTQAPGVLP